MYSDLKNLHYNPYAPEFSKLFCEGKASRAQWRVAGPVVNTMIRTKTFLGRTRQTSLKWLDLKPEDLKITRPAPPDAESSTSPENAAPAKPNGNPDAGRR